MNDNATKTKSTRRFTVDEANAMLPLVRSIASDIADVFRQVTGRRADVHKLLRRGSRSVGEQYDKEVAESRADLEEEYNRIWQYREELESLGVVLRQSEDGGIEFPTVIDGREAFYCWQLGETHISHWRYADAPHSVRRPLHHS